MIKDEITNRIILPRYLYFLNGNLYLNALDLDAKADRVFKLNLIKKCEIGSATENQTYENNEYSIQVLLEIDKQFVNFIERNTVKVERKPLYEAKARKNSFFRGMPGRC